MAGLTNKPAGVKKSSPGGYAQSTIYQQLLIETPRLLLGWLTVLTQNSPRKFSKKDVNKFPVGGVIPSDAQKAHIDR